MGRTPVAGDDVGAFDAAYDGRRAAVEARGPVEASDALVVGHDWDLEHRSRDPLLHTTFAGLDWSLEVVDVRHVVASQPAIRTTNLEARLQPVLDDPSSLLEFCIPIAQPLPPEGAISDADRRGYTLASPNPNLRIVGSQVQTTDISPEEGLSPLKVLGITFFVTVGTSYLQVARYRDRYFLRDGYHRAVGLLRAGLHSVPCVYINARTFEEAVGVRTGTMFGFETLLGDRPPRLSDFWDDSVSADIALPPMRRVVRVFGEEFHVQG